MVERLKKVLSPLYTDRCTVFEKRPFTEDGRTRFEKNVRHENVPCRVSAKAYLFGENAAKEKDRMLTLNKRVKLFVPPEYVFEPGSEIEIESHGRIRMYGKSGEMSLYASHNEVMIELLENYA